MTRSTLHISRLIRFARASSNVSDLSCRNKALTAKLLREGYRYHKLSRAFSKFYRRHSGLVENIMLARRKFCNKVYWASKILHEKGPFSLFQNLELGKASTDKNVSSQSLWLDLVNINVYAKVYQNILLSSRGRAIFTFSEFGTRQSLDRW